MHTENFYGCLFNLIFMNSGGRRKHPYILGWFIPWGGIFDVKDVF